MSIAHRFNIVYQINYYKKSFTLQPFCFLYFSKKFSEIESKSPVTSSGGFILSLSACGKLLTQSSNLFVPPSTVILTVAENYQKYIISNKLTYNNFPAWCDWWDQIIQQIIAMYIKRYCSLFKELLVVQLNLIHDCVSSLKTNSTLHQ